MSDEGIRPSVLVIAGLIAVGCLFGVYQAFSFDPLERDPNPEVTEGGEHGRASHASNGTRQRDRAHRSRSSSRATGDYAHHEWNRETDLARGMALGLPSPTFWTDVQTRGIPRNDPQMAAMWRSFHYLSSNDPESGPELPFEPQAHRAELVDAEGDVDASPTSCQVRVLPVASGRFNCVVRVLCDGRVLYPNQNQTAGYVPCELDDEGQPVRAIDSGSTASDGDPLVDLDLSNGTITIEERDETGQQSYRATLRITS